MNRFKAHITYGMLLATFVASQAYADWAAFRGNPQRTAYLDAALPVPVNKPEWSFKTNGPIVSSPSISEGMLYVGSRDSNVYAIEIGNGTLSWKRKTYGWVDSSPLLRDGKAYVGSRDGYIYKLDAYHGDSLFAYCGALQLSSPAVADNGTVLSGVGPPLNRFSIFNPDETEQVWGAYFTQMSYSSPAVYGNTAVFGVSNSYLYGVDIDSRKKLWSLQTNGGVYMSTPAIFDTTVYFAPGDYDRNVYAVDLMDGKFFWKSSGSKVRAKTMRAMGRQINTMLLIQLRRMSPKHRDAVLQQLRDRDDPMGKLFAMGKEAKGAAAKRFVPNGGGIKTSSVAVDSQRVYVIQQELGYSADLNRPMSIYSLLALDRFDGTERWRFADTCEGERLGYSSSPIVAKDKVFFGWGPGRVYAVSDSTGEKLWADTLEGNIISSPAISDGKLFFATMDGYVYAYNLLDTPAPINFGDGTYCYPNPARDGVSNIQYYMEKGGEIEIRIYDAAERLVKIHRDSGISANAKEKLTWDVSRAANGVYFGIVTATYDDGTKDQKILKIAVLN